MNSIIAGIPSFAGGKINKEHLNNLLISGKSTVHAAKVVGCCESTASRALRQLRLGGVLRSKSKKIDIINMRQDGATYQEIAAATGRSVDYVRTLCWELGLTNEKLQNKR